jgi:hypothetical protein
MLGAPTVRADAVSADEENEMLERLERRLWLPTLLCATIHCGAVEDGTAEGGFFVAAPATEGSLIIERPSAHETIGRYVTQTHAIEFASERSSPLSGDVKIRTSSLSYDVHYDYDLREVIADGYDGALDRDTHLSLRDAIEQVSQRLGPNDPTLPLHEQMLFASLALLSDSSGMPLPRMEFPLGPAETDATARAPRVDKSLGNDGVSCIERDTTYAVSFDYGDTVIQDEPITANRSQCNGQCGPSCFQLTPWLMWTLDCLEHDTCCGATSDDPCWTPLGECGDEYVHAELDFLRGFDPFSRHCGG